MSSTEMKSYLSLIPISAKVRRRQNRMTILCIVLAVFLVTVVFSMADMAIRMETSNQLNKNGNWHIMVKDISPETAAELAAQEDVAAFSAYSDINACNGVQREHNKKLNNGLPILHKVPPKRDYGRYFCIMAEKGGTSHGGLTEKLSPFFHAKKQEVNAYGR